MTTTDSMQVKRVNQGSAEVALAVNELLLIANAINEVCHALDMPEFATRMGADRDEALRLLLAVQAAYDQVCLQTAGRP